MKITVEIIEEMAKKIHTILCKLDTNFCLVYNGKVIDGDGETSEMQPHEFNPIWDDKKFIIGISYDGEIYHMFEYDEHEDIQKQLNDVCDSYCCYIEINDYGYAQVYANEQEMLDDLAQNNFPPKKPIYIWNASLAPTNKIENIMTQWFLKSQETGDKGGCVLGAKLHFKLNDQNYVMPPQSPYQGEMSWCPHIEWVTDELKKLGATDIWYDCGILD